MNADFGDHGCGVHYPKDLPVECFKEIVRIVRGGTAKEELSDLACHGWNVQGYAQKLGFGDPHDDLPPLVGASDEKTEPLTDEEACDYLESAYSMKSAEETTAIPWLSIAMWIIKLIFDLRNK